jgi:hypothetical protein
VLRTAFYFIPSVMTGFIVSVFPFRNRVSSKEAFEVLELGEGKLSHPVLRGPGGRKAARLLGEARGSLTESITNNHMTHEILGVFPASSNRCRNDNGCDEYTCHAPD